MTGSRKTVPIVLLVLGIVWTIPTQIGWHDSGTETTVASIAPGFELRVRRGGLYLGGHTSSAHHERRLLAAADRHFPGYALETRFAPLGPLPDWWEAATLELLASLPSTLLPSGFSQ